MISVIEARKTKFAYEQVIRPHQSEQRHTKVCDEDDEQREQQRPRHGFLGIVNFLAGCCDAIEANKAKEASRSALERSAESKWKEATDTGRVGVLRWYRCWVNFPVLNVSIEENGHDDISNYAEIQHAEDVVDAGRLFEAKSQSRADEQRTSK